jgi:fructokinase
MNRITSIGEILFDVYPDCRTLGGASFNFLFHIRKLTGKGHFVSRIGDDTEGKEIIAFLKRNDIPVDYIQMDSVHPTGESIATLNEIKVPSWEIKTQTAYDFIEPAVEIENLIKNDTDCLYFGTLAQRHIVSKDTIHKFFKMKIKYFCDLNIRQNFYTDNLIRECINTADVLKLNIDELHLVNNIILKKKFDRDETSKRLLEEFHLDVLCVTHGDQGADIFRGNEHNHFIAKIDNVIDTVGAGDAYAAILCIGYLKNWDIYKINKVASDFAGEIVKINGALPSNPEFYEKYKEIINDKSLQ